MAFRYWYEVTWAGVVAAVGWLPTNPASKSFHYARAWRFSPLAGGRFINFNLLNRLPQLNVTRTLKYSVTVSYITNAWQSLPSRL
ncbi:hypothetical protein EDD15DRAFT_871050 [Pisolithus albus]|nr:hypothetical protein EDD15DRAFT_871050 [Pisolithus albus]